LANQIVDELARYPNGIAAKFADRLHAEVTRSFDKWRARKHAAASGSTASEDTPWPQIYVVPGELPRVVNEAEAALLALGREIYHRGGLMVRPVLSKLKAADDRDTKCWNLIPVTRPHLAETLTRAAQFLKWDSRAKGFVPTNAPDRVAETYLARQGEWKLPILSGVANAPFLRTDGSICERPGYDATSGILFKPDGQDFPTIPQHPSRDDALTALALIDALISTFPFVASADRSVALSAILTALDRRAMATAPLHAFTAPAPGSGKSLLVDIAATLATGQLAPVIAQGRSEEELEKRLGAALLAGDAVISIDNCEYPLGGSLLCQTLTQQRLNIRLLGQSRHVEVPVNAAIFATGNNLAIVGDLTRRVLLCSIDPRCERPELRQFDTDVIKAIQANRGILVAAALTVLRAWHVAGDRVEVSPFGSFNDWSHRIRGPISWLGRADPCDTALKVRDRDPKRAALNAVLMQWREHIGIGRPYTVQQVINAAVNVVEFHAALLSVAVAGNSSMVSNERLGRWFKKVEGQIVEGLTLSQEGMRTGYSTWCLRLT
jgi:putative DNA primase/helicase